MTTVKNESVIQFPCDFTLKIMGKAEADFAFLVTSIVRDHYPNIQETAIQQKFSKDNKFLSLSVTVHATSKLELDALYQALSKNPKILMVL